MRKLNPILIIIIIAFVTSCANRMDMKLSKTLEELKNNNGKEVTISGIYRKAYINQHPSNKEFHGLYEIQINDSLAVLLEAPYDSKAKRPEAEVRELEGKKVIATGIIYDKSYMEKPSIETPALSVTIPCLREITKIEEAK